MFVSRAHRWASKPLREVLSFFRPWGGLSKFFFRAAADVFFGRAASVETCEVSGAVNGRPGRPPAFCAAAPRRPSTSVLSALPRDLLRGAPWVEVQRDRPRGFVFGYSRGCARLLRRGSLLL